MNDIETRADCISEPEEFGILVTGYNRPGHLESVLSSLQKQGHTDKTHVWIDGTQKRSEYADVAAKSVQVARQFPVREVVETRGHLGIEKLMLDALDQMSQRYRSVLVLEDDCFPLQNGVDRFRKALAEVADRPDVYSVYGHPFGTEPENERDFTRFQGWGWAAHSDQIQNLLPELKRLFMLTEAEYLDYIATNMTDDIRRRLHRTPGRDVLNVLKMFYSWDSATSFVTARRRLLHRRTEPKAVVNTGIIEGIGHFTQDSQRLRNPPLNMITLEEAWDHYDKPLYHRSILIIGHPRGGTMFTAKMLGQMGFDIGHERNGADGFASWMLTVDTQNAPYAMHPIAENRRNLQWDNLILPTRDIAAAAPSVMRENCYAPPSYQFRRDEIRKKFGLDLDDLSNDFERAVASIVYWMRMAYEMKPDLVFRIEDQPEKLQDYAARLRPEAAGVTLDTNPVNANKLYKGVTYPKPDIDPSDWAALPDSLKAEVSWYCDTFGYASPL
ncbi:hypothetical protein [Thalassovita mangrovi]|nr:hypothetical protein [Thalassovita mangrovi]